VGVVAVAAIDEEAVAPVVTATATSVAAALRRLG
jgi:hypothetical protein